MIRNLKTLGIALCAVLALTAAVASAASANYTASTYPTTGTGESALGNDVFKTEAGNVECKTHYEGTLTGSSASLSVKTKYSNCKAFGFLEATVEVGECHKLYTNAFGSGDVWFAKEIHEKCTGPKKTKIKTATCALEIGEQTTTGSVDITINTAGKDVTLQATITGIKYTVTEDGFACPFGGTGAKTGATYTQGSPITFASTNGATIDVG